MKVKLLRFVVLGLLLIGAVVVWAAAPAKFVARPTAHVLTIQDMIGPQDIEVDSDGMIYVADGTTKKVHIYQPDGTPELTFGHIVKKFDPENDPMGLVDMGSIGLDQDNNIYVCETKAGRIRVFNPYGEPLLTIKAPDYLKSIVNDAGIRIYKSGMLPEARKLPGRKVYRHGQPFDVAISENGNIYATDPHGKRILVFDFEGNLLTTFDYFRANNALNVFNGPNTLGFNSKGELFVIETPPCIIVVVDAKGNYLRHFGRPGTVVGSFQRPTGIAIDDLDRVYVADFVIGSVQVFDDQGNFLHVLTGVGGAQWGVGNLMGIAVDPKQVYLTEPLGRRFHVRKFVK